MLTFLKPGIYTTVQDTGRFFGSHLGIPVSGPMDARGARFANLTLENNENDALLECTFVGPTIKFQTPTCIAIKGAAVTVFVNDKMIDHSSVIQINAEDVLSFGKLESGTRVYVAIKGGLQSQSIHGSRSTCHTAGILRPLKKGDQLDYISYTEKPSTSFTLNRIIGNTVLSVTKGPEYNILSETSKSQIFESSFTVLPSSNRMAYRVKHTLDLSHSHSILSSGTIPGTVQLTPSGELICLMRDTQSTGGYPRVLQLSEEAICDLSQLSPNKCFSFKMLP